MEAAAGFLPQVTSGNLGDQDGGWCVTLAMTCVQRSSDIEAYVEPDDVAQF